MCGRYTLHTEKELLARRFGFDPEALGELEPHYNVAPTDDAIVVRVRHGERRVERMRWGLVPPWLKELGKGPSLINARAETAAERPAYRKAFRRRRCLILADGFYEWQPTPLERGPKLPHWIALPDEAPFAFAGLYELWWPPGSEAQGDLKLEPLLSCALLTTSATEDLAAIHARMPVILPPGAESAWLDTDLDDQVEPLQALLEPVASGSLVARPVSRRVNSVSNDGPELIALDDPPQTGFRLEG